MKTTIAIDRGGIFVGISCLIHCVFCALFPAVWGILGTSAELGERLEWGLTLLAIVVALATLIPGWRRLRSRRIVALFAAGIILMLGARVVEHFQHPEDASHEEALHVVPEEAHAHDEEAAHHVVMFMAILAALFLISGHMASLRASRCCPPVKAAL